mmetsp:Transcript_39642/g.88718  ORF Transcript_39642/g.88718 Transcript_39642/m.88718 type:complete len:94 (-) Transcript_39642:1150-1431(-)
MAGAFGMFNLEMPPPKWAKDFMQFKWAGRYFVDHTEATRVMRGHFFYMVSTMLSTFILHRLFIEAWKKFLKNRPMPKKYAMPGVRHRSTVALG